MGTRGPRSKKRLSLGSLHHRGERKFQWYVWRYYDREGRRVERSTGERELDAATKVAEEWAIEELAIRNRLIAPAASTVRLTLQEAAERYLRANAGSWAKKYAYEVARYFDKWILPIIGGGSTVDEITSEAIQGFKQRLVSSGLKPTSVNKVLCSIRRLLVFCAEAGEIKNVPTIKNMKRQQEQHGRVLTRHERLRLLVAACRHGLDYLCFVGFGLYCGLRNTEARRVEWGDVDFEKGLIRLKDQKNRTAMPAPLGKMAEILERVPKEKRQGRIVCYVDIFTGERRPTDALRKTWRTIKRIAGIKGELRYHDLRHSFITECYSKLPPTIAPVMARHSSRDATAMYIHLERNENMKEALKIF